MVTDVNLVTHVMAKALETQASHMDQRAETSSLQLNENHM